MLATALVRTKDALESSHRARDDGLLTLLRGPHPWVATAHVVVALATLCLLLGALRSADPVAATRSTHRAMHWYLLAGAAISALLAPFTHGAGLLSVLLPLGALRWGPLLLVSAVVMPWLGWIQTQDRVVTGFVPASAAGQ